MPSDNEASGPNRRMQSLVQICQRVAGNHIESISSLGELPFSLVKPMLERCSAEQLLRVEEASPHLQRDSDDLWRNLCFRTYPAMVERYDDEADAVQDLWRNRFFDLREAEARRLEEVGSRIRSQRREAEERKKEREVKLTDRLPPPKRQRGWNMPTQPKTLFQKTRSEASKLQKNIYNARMIPPMPKGKDYRPTGHVSGNLSPQSSYTNRVTVSTVTRRPPTTNTSSSGTSTMLDSASSKDPLPTNTTAPTPSESPTPLRSSNATQLSSNGNVPLTTQPSSSPEKLLSKPLSVAKRDPMASLFVPKNRAYSQRTR